MSITYTHVKNAARSKGYRLERLNSSDTAPKTYTLWSQSGPGAYLMATSADLSDILKAVGPFTN